MLHLRGPVLAGPDREIDQVWVDNGRISLHPPADRRRRGVRRLDGFVLPGLVDAHCHIGLAAEGAADRDGTERQALADRDAGTLLVRDAGQPGDTRWIDGREDLPAVVRAGRHLARSRRYLRGYGRELEPEHLVTAVREEARRGDGWVKLVGDWIDREVGDLAPCWPAEALTAAVAAAHAEGARVTAHCFGEDCLPDLLAAGIDCVEHATGLAGDVLTLAAERGVAVVPTLVNIANFPSFAAAGAPRYPAYAAHMLALHERRYATVWRAHEAGVPVYCGTDAGGTLPHGILAREVAELVVAGLPPVAALDAACWAARAWLGRPGVEEGAPADLVVYGEDPRRVTGVLAAPRAVVLRGRVVLVR
ncbi:MAG: amidohydrolase family protein [Actinomycetales bacterium]|nr:amidohydrolase family protein [Actinomycetales bacterium]